MLRLNSVNSNGPAPPVADRAGAMQRAETVGPEMHIECEPRGLAKRRALQAQLHRGAPGVVLATPGRQNPSSKALRAGTHSAMTFGHKETAAMVRFLGGQIERIGRRAASGSCEEWTWRQRCCPSGG